MNKVRTFLMYVLFYLVRITSYVVGIGVITMPVRMVEIWMPESSTFFQVLVAILLILLLAVIILLTRMVLMQCIFGAQNHSDYKARLQHWFAPHRNNYQRYNSSMVVIHCFAVSLVPFVAQQPSDLLAIPIITSVLIVLDAIINIIYFKEDIERELRN